MEFLNSSVLSLMTFAPLLTAALVMLVPFRFARWVAMGGAVLTFLLSAHVWYYFDASTPGLQFTEAYEWMPAFGIKYIMGVDGLSLLLVVLSTFLTPLILLSLWER